MTYKREVQYAIEVKFIHPFNARNINMLEEVITDNEKLRLATEHSDGFVKAINLNEKQLFGSVAHRKI